MEEQKQDLKFFEIKDKVMIQKVLDAVHRHKIKITAWIKDQSVRFDTYLLNVFSAQKRLYLKPPGEQIERQILIEASDTGTEPFFGTFEIDRLMFFFKTTLLQDDVQNKNVLHVQVPEVLFKLQRRANLRIHFHRVNAPKVYVYDAEKFKDLPVTEVPKDKNVAVYRVLDISAGGMALAAPIQDLERFKKGERLTRLYFNIKGEDITTDAVITHVRETTSDLGQPIVKIGMKFERLGPGCEKKLFMYVLDESRRAFSLLY